MTIRFATAFILSTVVAGLLSCELQAAQRYGAMFMDGTRVEEAEVREWCDPAAHAKIGGRNLFDANNPVRWIVDRQQPIPAEATMYVEFFGGDRLAGEVVSYRTDSGNPYDQLPAHLVVRPLADVQPPENSASTDVRINMEWIRRIVWQRSSAEEYRPGTVRLRSGGLLTFRTLRWADGAVTLLTTDGIKELSFADLAEVHLPKLDPWSCYYDQLAVLSPELKSRLIQFESAEGSSWTTSMERFQPRHHGDRNRPEQWFQMIQPAWSLDPFWVRYRSIRAWRFFTPTDVPMSNLLPIDVRRQAVFGSGWNWRINQNVQRGQLQSATQEFGWGFGVQATCDLTFEWPETARAWRTGFGLDRAAGSGGFAKLSFTVGNDQPTGPQPDVQGSQFVGDTEWQPLPAVSANQRRLKFRADMAHADRPPEADPFDVRDAVNWYEPELRLDPTALAAEVASRMFSRISGLNGWTLAPTDTRILRIANMLDVLQPRDPQFRMALGTSEKFYTVSRKLKIGSQQRWLSVVASRFPASTPTYIQVKIDERSKGEFDVPIRDYPSDPDPILISVDEYQGKTVNVEYVVFPVDSNKSFVDWRATTLTVERPGLLPIFEDDPGFASKLNRGTGQVEIVSEKPFSGSASLKVTPDAGDNPQLPGLDVVISDQPKLGQYRLALFAWKQATGSSVQIQFANDGRLGDQIGQIGRRGEQPRSKSTRGKLRYEGPAEDRGLRYAYAYDGGTRKPQPNSPLRLVGALPKDWQLQKRDLFGDFGLFNLTGLALTCHEGEAAWFDHIYLARTYRDVEFAATYLVNPIQQPAKDPSLIDLTFAPPDYGRLVAPFAPQFSTHEVGHGLFREVTAMGQSDALRTYPVAPDKPMIFRAGVTLPKDKPSMLDMHVSHHPVGDWLLVVKVNGEVIHQELIDQKLTVPQKGWATIQVDLAKFAGQKVYIEVLNQSNNWSNEFAYWKWLNIVTK